MILDTKGRPLRRAIGFVGDYAPVRKAQTLADALNVVGFEVPLEPDEEEAGAARNRNRMRRAA